MAGLGRRDLGVDFQMFGQYLEPAFRQDIGAAGNAVQGYAIAGIDFQDRFKCGAEYAPMHGVRAGGNLVIVRQGLIPGRLDQ